LESDRVVLPDPEPFHRLQPEPTSFSRPLIDFQPSRQPLPTFTWGQRSDPEYPECFSFPEYLPVDRHQIGCASPDLHLVTSADITLVPDQQTVDRLVPLPTCKLPALSSVGLRLQTSGVPDLQISRTPPSVEWVYAFRPQLTQPSPVCFRPTDPDPAQSASRPPRSESAFSC
jgi:hypothetical protein